MRVFNFSLGVVVGFGLVLMQPSAAAPQPETRTIVETKYIKQYIKVNQTEPMELMTTAYTPGPESTGKRPGMKGYGITKTGTEAKRGVCAVDPEYIPLGTSLYVESYGYCRAEDTGEAIKGNKMDVYYDDLDGALKFGRKKLKVWVLKDFDD